MVFDTELTDYHLEGEVSGDEESSSDDSDGEKEDSFWPGDFNQEDENLGRQHFDTCLEDQNKSWTQYIAPGNCFQVHLQKSATLWVRSRAF